MEAIPEVTDECGPARGSGTRNGAGIGRELSHTPRLQTNEAQCSNFLKAHLTGRHQASLAHSTGRLCALPGLGTIYGVPAGRTDDPGPSRDTVCR